MPHQSGDPSHGFRGRAGPGSIMDGREYPGDLRRMGPRLVHHPSPGGHSIMHHPSPGGQAAAIQARHLQTAGMYAPHPHSPAAWYGSSVAGSPPHRVPGSSLSAASGSFVEDQQQQHMVAVRKEVPGEALAAEMRDKERIIQEALKRHMDDDNSIGTNEADAASALLFATAAMRQAEGSSKVSVAGSKGEGQEEVHDEETSKEEDGVSKEDTQGEETEESEKSTVVASSMPLKKRRKLLDILRKKPVTTANAENTQSLHVSPLPSPQVQTRVAGRGSSDDTVTSTSPQRTAGSSSTCMGNSYDTKDAQCLPEGAKIQNTTEISRPSPQLVMEHLPTVLHSLLVGGSGIPENVVQWLPDGKAWKIIRWDALRRQVLPKFLPNLQDEEGKVASSIDAFLWQLSGWGFEEIQSGPDAGAYSHEMFIKDDPGLCRQMKFTPLESDLKKSPSTISEKMHAASQPHSILQVPSLASTSRPDLEGPFKEAEKNLKWREEQAKHRMMHSPTIAYSSMAGRPMRHPETPLFVNYHMGDVAYTDGYQYFPESPMGARRMGSALTGYEQHLVHRQHLELGMVNRAPLALHSSPQRSGRGVSRLAVVGKTGIHPVEHTPVRRSSFPVSSRGKGSRSPACRIPITPNESASTVSKPSAGSSKEEGCEGLQKLSEEVAKRVALAISTKTKRKLPMASAAAGSRDKSFEEECVLAEKPEDTKDDELETGKTASV